MVSFDEEFARTITTLHGEAGRAWLGGLDALVEHCARRWELKVGPPFAPLSYNYVAPAEGPRGERYVLKLGVPTRGLLGEVGALLAFDGRGAARLFDSDDARGALLIERLEPGTPLTTLCEEDDLAATAAAAAVMRKLRQAGRPHTRGTPTAADWGLGFERARVRGWGLAQAVLSAWWTIEDEGEFGEHNYAAARILAAAKI